MDVTSAVTAISGESATVVAIGAAIIGVGAVAFGVKAARRILGF